MITAAADVSKITDWDVVWLSAAGAAVTAGTLLFLVLQNLNGARSAIIEQDRRTVLKALQEAGTSYAEAATSLLIDARRRAFGTAWLNYQAANGVRLPIFEEQMDLDKLTASEQGQPFPGSQETWRLRPMYDNRVIEEIGSSLAELAAEDVRAYAARRNLMPPVSTTAIWILFVLGVAAGFLALATTAR